MKVKELIVELLKLDQELDVYVPVDSFSEGYISKANFVHKHDRNEPENEVGEGYVID